MSADRLSPPIDIIDGAIRRAHIAERLRCANVASQYPLEGFEYDTRSHGDVLRLRDAISEAILKGVPAGEMIR